MPTHNEKHADTLFINANLATMAGEGYGIIENVAVGITDGRISYIGTEVGITANVVHDLAGKWLTPGLVDCHTHLVYAGNRAHEFAARQAGKTYAQIAAEGGGIAYTVKQTRAASEAELFAQSEKRLQHFLREGVTTMEIKSGYGLDLDTELKMLRVAKKLGEKYPVTIRKTFLGAHSVPAEFKGRADEYIDAVVSDMIPAIAKEKLADAVDGFCEHIAFTPAQIARVFDAAKKHGLAVKLHAEQLSDQGGAAMAAQYKALSADHLEFASEEGIKAMAASGTVAVLLPGAFYMLKEKQKPPVELLRKHGVAIALASDCNPGTSPVLSLVAMLNMGCTLFGLTPEEALRGITVNAAKALGIADIGTLEVGKVADLAIWDITHPQDLAYHLGGNACVGTIKKGQYNGNHS
ncbi:MAG: imidazolonepropionase [Alphaproteobacteria bacterium]